MPESGAVTGPRVIGWRAATEAALRGPEGFYRRERAAAHFVTSAQRPEFAVAVAELARRLSLRAVLDLGAASGELLRGLHALDPGLGLHGVDLAPRPPGLPASIAWSPALPSVVRDSLLVAHEWLDTVAVEVVEQTAHGPRLVLVDPADGAEELGGPPADEDLAWLERWWPPGAVGARAEPGRPRDAAWVDVLARMSGGAALAVDYAHTRAERAAGSCAAGTLRGHRDGRLVAPVPDGRCDITSAVALDAVQAAAEQAGAVTVHAGRQRDALADLLPAPEGLDARLALVRLREPDGPGSFGWLLQRPFAP